jgi:hypothetical protein
MYFQRHASARCYCPADGCGAAFLVEEDDDEEEENGTVNGIVMGPNANLFQCPECSTLFCRFCRALGSQCKCFQLEVGKYFHFMDLYKPILPYFLIRNYLKIMLLFKKCHRCQK